MSNDRAGSSVGVVARYFEMWNTGDASIADEVLSADWVDHAHPEVTGPADVRRAVESVRRTRPDLRFDIESILGDGDLVAAVGEISHSPSNDSEERAANGGSPDAARSRLVWVVRLRDGRMTDMRTYRENLA